MNPKSTGTPKQNDYLYPMNEVCQFADTKTLKKVNSVIKEHSLEDLGLDMGVRIKVDDYEDKANERIIRKATILGASIIRKEEDNDESRPSG